MNGMRSSARKIKGPCIEELFRTSEEIADSAKEKVEEIALT